jgi:hypothetical protein
VNAVGWLTIGAWKEEAPMSLTTSSIAFAHNAEIPAVYTGEGKDVSPPLAWSGVPAGTKSLALIVDDPDAPDPAAPKMSCSAPTRRRWKKRCRDTSGRQFCSGLIRSENSCTQYQLVDPDDRLRVESPERTRLAGGCCRNRAAALIRWHG